MRLSRYAAPLSFVAVIAVAALAAEPPPARHVLRIGDVEVIKEAYRTGLQIRIGGVECTRTEEIVVTKPPWAPHYYLGPNLASVRDAVLDRAGDAQRLTLRHRGDNDTFEATETLTLHPDGRLEQVFDGAFLLDDLETLVQWRIAGFNPALIIGVPYRATLIDGSEKAGVVPILSKSADAKDTTIARGFRRLEIDTRLGPLAIEVLANPDAKDAPPPTLSFYDFRRSPWANPDEPMFWFGEPGAKYRKGERIYYHIVYHLPGAKPQQADAAGASVTAPTRPTPREHAQLFAQTDPPTLIPRPKEVTFADGVFDATELVQDWLHMPARVATPPNGAPAVRPLHSAVLHALASEDFGTWLKAAMADAATNDGLRIADGDVDLPAVEGAYTLTVDQTGIVIRARDEAGRANACRTLRQLMTLTPDRRVVARHAAVRDWPSLSFRGVHFFTGGKGPALHMQLLSRLMGPLKMNHLVLQTDYLKWDGHPNIHHATWGMSKAEVGEILDEARNEGIDVTPLVMSLGHMTWMFHNNQNLDLAEDPEAKWAYCVTNPESYAFIFSVFDEAIELFQPPYFHIGHDEFADRGRVPYRESSKPYTIEQLFLMDMEKMAAYFGEKKLPIMMWGDMLLAPGEAPDACNAPSKEIAAKKRAAIPDGTIIADWHYVSAPPEKYTSLKLFHDEGLRTLACPWNRPGNIVNFAKAAFDANSMGLLQTTWAGFSLEPETFLRELPQYGAYVLAAEAAWNADNPPKPDAYPFMSYFLDLMGMTPLTRDMRGGWTLDLGPASNASLIARAGGVWSGVTPEFDLSLVPTGETRLQGVLFAIDAQRRAVALRSRLTPNTTGEAGEKPLPGEVVLPIGAAAERVVVLHTTLLEAGKDRQVGEYEVVFEGGKSRKFPVIYGQHVFAYSNPSATPDGPIVWAGKTPGGQPAHLRAMVLDLKETTGTPPAKIEKLVLRSGDAPASLVVLGVTGLTESLRP